MKYIYLILLVFLPSAYGSSEFSSKHFLNEWSSPLYAEESRSIIYTGSTITAIIIIGRDSGFDQFQEDMAKNKPMGDLAHFGDYMGQLIPNLAYMGGMYWNYKKHKDQKSLRRSILMLKTTLYSGLTTDILKRIVNEKRPNGGDRFSFPSGHTTTTFAFASIVGLEHSQAWAIAAYTLAGIVGFSRMNDNAHYLQDVVSGATIGMAYGYSLHHLQRTDSKNSSIVWNFIPAKGGAIASLSYQFN